jgi:hypothetical protein
MAVVKGKHEPPVPVTNPARNFRFSLRQVWIGLTMLCVVLGLWTATATRGVQDVEQRLSNELGAKVADRRAKQVFVEPPSFKTWDGMADFPLVVSIRVKHDWGLLPNSGIADGTIRQAHFLWFFGLTVRLPDGPVAYYSRDPRPRS